MTTTQDYKVREHVVSNNTLDALKATVTMVDEARTACCSLAEDCFKYKPEYQDTEKAEFYLKRADLLASAQLYLNTLIDAAEQNGLTEDVEPVEKES